VQFDANLFATCAAFVPLQEFFCAVADDLLRVFCKRLERLLHPVVDDADVDERLRHLVTNERLRILVPFKEGLGALALP